VKVSFPQYLAKQPREVEEIYSHGLPKLSKDWKHENCSLDMIDFCLKQLGLEIDDSEENLDKPLRQIGDGIDSRSMRVLLHEPQSLTASPGNAAEQDVPNDEMILTSRDFIFINECVWGGTLPLKRHLIGRPQRKHEWMYNIVTNSHSGLDVDKIDYQMRNVTIIKI
jgi:deoxynucleoside triphosphate triphosphohydrolase SAMHD1